jgi:hypothetical protein
MTTTIHSSWIFQIMCIYGEDDTFNGKLFDYLGSDADYYLEHSNIFIEEEQKLSMYFNKSYGKKHNKIITSIVRAFLESYDSIKMNEFYLKMEEEFKNREDIFTLAHAHILSQLKEMHEDLQEKRFIIQVTDERFAILKVI